MKGGYFMVYGLGLLIAFIFAVLSLFHVYWALGGKLGSTATVPFKNERRLFTPSKPGTIMVAIALLIAMLTVLGQLNVWGGVIPKPLFYWGTLDISLLFFLRAVGEFRFVGFFKRIRDTRFAHWDTWLFSPLCLFISISAFVIAYDKA
jgi:hypothetical protein